MHLIHVHPIILVPPIVSTSASWKTTHVADIRKSRLLGKSQEWHFVAAVENARDSSGQHGFLIQPFGLISHDAVAYLNRHRSRVWSVPLILCQKYDDVIGPTRFTMYQQVAPLPSDDALDRLATAFDTRMRVVKWLKASGGFQLRHPLSSSDLLYAGVNTDAKQVDTMVYHLLACALKWVPGAKPLWRESESELLLLKLLLRPQLHAHIFDIVGRPPGVGSFEAAANRIEAVHDHYASRLSPSDDSGISRELPLMRLAIAYLQEIERWDAHRKHEANIGGGSSSSSNTTATTTAATQHELATLLQCSPMCMRNALTAVTGARSTAVQAATPAHVRRQSELYLMTAGFSAQTVTQLMRPKIMIEYELESPKETWAGIENGVKHTASVLAYSKKADPQEQHARFAAQSCSAVMKAGLCPFLQPQRPHPAPLQQQRPGEQDPQFIRAKRWCHAELQAAAEDIEAARQQDEEGRGPARKRKRSSNSQSGKTSRTAQLVHVPKLWVSGPLMFAEQHATMRGLTIGAGHVDAALQV